jgi:hypothetical protein
MRSVSGDNIYDARGPLACPDPDGFTAPHLTGGPRLHCDAPGLPDGEYYFQVTDPSGAKLLSSDAIEERRLLVQSGKVTAYLGKTHGTGPSACPGSISVALAPFDKTPNAGGEYKAWMTPVGAYVPQKDWRKVTGHNFGFFENKSKTDNYKCRDSISSRKLAISCPLSFEACNAEGECGASLPFEQPVVVGGTAPYTLKSYVDGVEVVSPYLFPVGETTITFTVTDSKGATASCSFTVKVHDCEAPDVTCPSAIVRGSDAGKCSAVVDFAPSADDNCAVASVTPDPPSGSTFPVGTTTVNVTAVDTSGNESMCSFTVTVDDTEAPAFTFCPGDATVGTDDGACGAVVSWVAPVAEDACGVTSLTTTPASGSFFATGSTTVIATASDAAGNSSTCTFTITVVDDEAPVASCPAPIVASNDPGLCSAVVSFQSSVSDNCDGAAISCTPASGSVFPVGTTTVQCTATDAAGSQSTCSFTVTVNDDEAPTVTCPADATLEAGVPGETGEASAGDNCDAAPGVTSEDVEEAGCGASKTIARTWTATDAAGNSTSCVQTITVQDTTPPVVSACAPTTVLEASAECDAPAPDLTAEVAAADVSGFTVTQDPPAGTLLGVGLHTITLTLTDACGSSSTCTTTVAVTPPGGGLACLGAGGGHTLGFWQNKNGEDALNDGGSAAPELAMLSALHLRNADGSDFDPASHAELSAWLTAANGVNMANMLSAQLAAMALNVEAGFVLAEALVWAPGTASPTGFATIGDLIEEADAALAADGFTPDGDPNRDYQTALKNALDNGNNNRNFVQ